MSVAEEDEVKAPKSTGASKMLRTRLRAKRLELGLTQQEVVDRIASITGERAPNRSALDHWEHFRRHPPISTYAAWARALGLRLVVELDDATSERVPVLVPREMAEEIKAYTLLSPQDMAMVADMVRRLTRSNDSAKPDK